MTAPRMTDEARAPKRMSEERFRALLAETGRQVEGPLKEEASRARSSESALLARVERLEGSLRDVAACGLGLDLFDPWLRDKIRTALSEKP